MSGPFAWKARLRIRVRLHRHLSMYPRPLDDTTRVALPGALEPSAPCTVCCPSRRRRRARWHDAWC